MRSLFFCCLLALAGTAHSQAIVPVFQTGHQLPIDFIDVNRADNLLLTADQQTVMLWNTQTGRLLRILRFSGKVCGALLCQKGSEIAVLHYTQDGQRPTLQFFEASTGLRRSTLAMGALLQADNPNLQYPEPRLLVRNSDGSRVTAYVDNNESICEVQVASRRQSALVRLPAMNYRDAFSMQFTAQADTYFVAYRSEQDSLEVALLDRTGTIRRKKVVSPTKDSWPVTTISNRQGTMFYLLGNDGAIEQFDLNLTGKKITQIGTGFDKPRLGTLALSADERLLICGITGTSSGWSTEIYDLTTSKKIVSTGCDADLVCFYANDTRRLALVKDKKIVLIDQRLPTKADSLFDSHYTYTYGAELFNLTSTVPPENNLTFNSSGTIMALGQQGRQNATCQRLDLLNGRSAFSHSYRISQWLNDSVALCLSPDSTAGPDDEFFKFQKRNIRTGKLLDTYQEAPSGFDENGQFKRAVSAGQVLMAYANGQGYSDRKGFIHVASGPHYTIVKQIPLHQGAFCHQLLFTPDSRYLVASLDSAVLVYEVATQQIRRIPLKHDVFGADVIRGSHRLVAVTADSREVLYTGTGAAYLGDADRGRTSADNMGSVALMAYNLTSGSVRMLHRWQDSHDSHAMVSAQICHPSQGLYAVGFEDGQVEVYSQANDKLLFAEQLHIAQISELCFRPQHPQLAALTIDGTIALANYGTRLPALKLAHIHNPQLKSGGFALVTADNYYLAPPAAVAQLHYAQGFNTYSFEQFDLRYNRPDKVLQALGTPDTALVGSYRRAYNKRLRRLRADTTVLASGAVPVARIANRNELPIAQTQPTLMLHIRATDPHVPLTQLQVWVNEVPIFGSRGCRLPKRTGLALDTTIIVMLSDGSNRIETSVTNAKGAESYRSPFFTTYTPAKPTDYRLFFVGIGINRFAEPGHDLHWSVKDIRDLTYSFSDRYGDIKIDTLMDRQVTVANVRQLRRVLQQTTVHDKVVVAYSGHGLFNATQDYFLSTYDVDFLNPTAKGLAYQELEGLLDSIPARRKLLLLDACHSGEVDRQEQQRQTAILPHLQTEGIRAKGATNVGAPRVGLATSFELMQSLFTDVSRHTGTTVIAAAAGTQLALEKNSLKNGVFTSCLLETMSFDYDNSARMYDYVTKSYGSGTKGHLSVYDLQAIINERVSALTLGLQVPTTRAGLHSTDWDVW